MGGVNVYNLNTKLKRFLIFGHNCTRVILPLFLFAKCQLPLNWIPIVFAHSFYPGFSSSSSSSSSLVIITEFLVAEIARQKSRWVGNSANNGILIWKDGPKWNVITCWRHISVFFYDITWNYSRKYSDAKCLKICQLFTT